jgi:arylsulfatase A-like enzyme
MLYDLNRNNHVVSLLDRIDPIIFVILSLVFLLVFLIAESVVIRLVRRTQYARYVLCSLVPALFVFVLFSLMFQQTRDRVGVVERSIQDSIALDRPENILLITLDTQRADFLGCYGHRDVESRNIDRLARDGVQFNYCIAHSPLTLPSHTSILTSTYPVYHGVRNNHSNALHSSVNTLAEVLSNNGYDTAAFLSSLVLTEEFGLCQGFDHYEIKKETNYLFYKRFYRELVFSKIFLSHVPFSSSFLDCWVESVTNKSISWMGESRENPFFVWIHYFNPHKSYAPPFPYAIPYLERMNRGVSGFFEAPEHFREKQVSRRELEWDRALYLGEITYTDYNIGLVLEALRALGLRSNTLIVLTADHGEAFGENEDVTHGNTLYDTSIRVPLIFNGQGLEHSGIVVDGLCESVDIMPTILDYVGISGPAEMQGKSLLPYLASGMSLPEGGGFLETMGPSREEMKLFGVVEDDWKFVYTPWGTSRLLFNLSTDPGETRNLVEEHPERARRMKAKMEGFLAVNTAEEKWERVELDVRSLHHLRALGYIQ